MKYLVDHYHLISFPRLNSDISEDLINLIRNPKHLPGTKTIRLRVVNPDGKFVFMRMADKNIADNIYLTTSSELVIFLIRVRAILKIKYDFYLDKKKPLVIDEADFSKEIIARAAQTYNLLSSPFPIYQFPDKTYQLNI